MLKLPKNWEKKVDEESDKVYWYNTESNEICLIEDILHTHVKSEMRRPPPPLQTVHERGPRPSKVVTKPETQVTKPETRVTKPDLPGPMSVDDDIAKYLTAPKPITDPKLAAEIDQRIKRNGVTLKRASQIFNGYLVGENTFFRLWQETKNTFILQKNYCVVYNSDTKRALIVCFAAKDEENISLLRDICKEIYLHTLEKKYNVAICLYYVSQENFSLDSILQEMYDYIQLNTKAAFKTNQVEKYKVNKGLLKVEEVTFETIKKRTFSSLDKKILLEGGEIPVYVLLENNFVLMWASVDVYQLETYIKKHTKSDDWKLDVYGNFLCDGVNTYLRWNSDTILNPKWKDLVGKKKVIYPHRNGDPGFAISKGF